jgi:hypothetical protein
VARIGHDRGEVPVRGIVVTLGVPGALALVIERGIGQTGCERLSAAGACPGGRGGDIGKWRTIDHGLQREAAGFLKVFRFLLRASDFVQQGSEAAWQTLVEHVRDRIEPWVRWRRVGGRKIQDFSGRGFRVQDSGAKVRTFILAPVGRFQISDSRFQP